MTTDEKAGAKILITTDLITIHRFGKPPRHYAPTRASYDRVARLVGGLLIAGRGNIVNALDGVYRLISIR